MELLLRGREEGEWEREGEGRKGEGPRPPNIVAYNCPWKKQNML